MSKLQIHDIKNHCLQLVSKHKQDVIVESQLDEGFYRDLDSLADISANNDFGDIQVNGYRSVIDCIECLVKVSAYELN